MPYSVTACPRGGARWLIRNPAGAVVASGREQSFADAQRTARDLDRRWHGQDASEPLPDPAACSTMKRLYPTQAVANEVAGRVNRHNLRRGVPGVAQAYLCPECHGWHVGREMKQVWKLHPVGGGA